MALLLLCAPFNPPNSYSQVTSQTQKHPFSKIQALMKRKGLLENQTELISLNKLVLFAILLISLRDWGLEERGGGRWLGCSREAGTAQVKCKSLGQMKVHVLEEMETYSGERQLGQPWTLEAGRALFLFHLHSELTWSASLDLELRLLLSFSHIRGQTGFRPQKMPCNQIPIYNLVVGGKMHLGFLNTGL